MMVNLLKIAFISTVLLSCKSDDSDRLQIDNCLPSIIIETNKDTLNVGEQYVAKVSLSDSSYYYLNDNGKQRPTNPVFRINGQIVESHEPFFFYKETVDSENTDTLQSGVIIRNWSVGVIFPHPKGGEVEVSYRSAYVIDSGSPSSTEL